MLATFSPFSQGALEEAFDDFLRGIADLETGISSLSEPSSIIPGLVAAVVTFSLAECARRRTRRSWDDQTIPHPVDEDSSLPGLPGLPGGWDSEEP